ncbi:MAG: S41 family peptidase [Chloroflexota bacterium]
MKSNILYIVVAIFFGFLGFGGGFLFGQSPWAPVQVFTAIEVRQGTPDSVRATFEPFWEVWHLVNNRYFDQPVDNVALMEGAIEGMLAALDDDNTRYLSPRDETRARQDMDGEISGIGAEVEMRDDRIVIVSPIDDSPAAEAGLQPGDIILEANGVDLRGIDLIEGVDYVRGPEGTAVTLLIERNGEQFEVEIIRARIRIDSVNGEMLADNIAYVRINRFGERTANELETILTDLLGQEPVGLIVDVRRNPGGGLEAALDVADQFLPGGTILIERFGDGRERIFEATANGLATDIPLVVLVDEGSASASEVLAGAIRDQGRGILIGETTFGKGTVQSWQPLSNGGGVRITIARWLTPNDTWIDQTGLEPDITVSLPDMEEFDEFMDTQLETAVDYLRQNGQFSNNN